MNTQSTRIGLSEHWHGGTKSGTVRDPMELAGSRHVEQSSELAVRREVCYVGVCCVVFVRLVCHPASEVTRPGQEMSV
jgi:hypothetical protein